MNVCMTKEDKIKRYAEMNKACQPGQTVFAGSSLMEMFPIEKFVAEDGLGVTVYNRGVGGFITQELMDNIETCILALAPSRLFINIGTNDLSSAQTPIENIMALYGQILDRVKEKNPRCRIYLMAYYPINYEAAEEEMKPCLKIRTNEKINRANGAVEKLAAEKGARFIDVNAPLKDEQGRLKAEYTIEGIHINDEGYRSIFGELMRYATEG